MQGKHKHLEEMEGSAHVSFWADQQKHLPEMPYDKPRAIPMVTVRAEGSSGGKVSNLCFDFSP